MGRGKGNQPAAASQPYSIAPGGRRGLNAAHQRVALRSVQRLDRRIAAGESFYRTDPQAPQAQADREIAVRVVEAYVTDRMKALSYALPEAFENIKTRLVLDSLLDELAAIDKQLQEAEKRLSGSRRRERAHNPRPGSRRTRPPYDGQQDVRAREQLPPDDVVAVGPQLEELMAKTNTTGPFYDPRPDVYNRKTRRFEKGRVGQKYGAKQFIKDFLHELTGF